MYRCPMCGVTYESLASLKRHFNREHRFSTTCPACGRSFVNWTSFMTHIRNKGYYGDDEHLALYYLLKDGRSKGMYKRDPEVKRLLMERVKNVLKA